MRFQAPLLLWLALPWLVAWALFARSQKRALAWVLGNVAERFRSRLSVHSPATLVWHLRLLAGMGLLLVAAAARPYLPGEAEVEAERARVILIFDASASMYATDVEGGSDGGDSGPRFNRFEAAREAASLLVESLPETSFALVSFSGRAAIHTPMSADRGFLHDALRGLEIHGQYQRSGSAFAPALDTILDFQDPTRPNLQAVLFSDGEQPVEEDVGGALDALAGQRVPVHALAIGSTEGQSRVIWDFRDIVAKKEKPTALRNYHTRRVDELLERIAETTGGHFEVLGPGSVVRLTEAVRDHRSAPARIERAGTGADLGAWFLLAFLIGFVADGLLIGRRPRHRPIRFEIERIGNRSRSRVAGIALVCTALLLASCGSSPRARAYRENEQGIALDALGRHEQARVHYKRAIGYGVRPEVPTFNLARSVHKEGDYSEAHDLYQEALKLDPRLAEAYYNDGIALYDWGEAERDPRCCELERTHELWTRALERFVHAVELTRPDETLGRMARNDHAHLEAQLAQIEQWIAEPPPECLGEGGGGGSSDSESEDQSAQGGGSGNGGQQDPGAGGGAGGAPEDEGDQNEGGGEDEGQEDPGDGSPDEPEGDAPPPPPGQDPGPAGGGAGGSPPPLSQDELDRISQALGRIADQGREPGKYHRRTLPEQFGEEHWSNPDRVIWW